MGLDCVPNHQHMLDMERGLIKPNPLMKGHLSTSSLRGLRLVNDAQLKLDEFINTHNAQMKEAGYVYTEDKNYDPEWAFWVHQDYINEPLERGYYPDPARLAKELGLEELPQGAIINALSLPERFIGGE